MNILLKHPCLRAAVWRSNLVFRATTVLRPQLDLPHSDVWQRHSIWRGFCTPSKDIDGGDETDDSLDQEDEFEYHLDKLTVLLKQRKGKLLGLLAQKENWERQDAEVALTKMKAEAVVANMYDLKDKIQRGSCEKFLLQTFDVKGETVSLEVEIDLKTFASLDEFAANLFQQARKGAKAPGRIDALLSKTYDDVDHIEHAIQLTQAGEFKTTLALEKHIFKATGDRMVARLKSNGKGRQPARFRPESPGICRYSGPQGSIIFVGRTRNSNDQVSLKLIKSNEVWMHASGCPGAHVAIRMPKKDEEPTPEILRMAADLAAHFSKMKSFSTVPVTVSRGKYLRKPKRAPPGAIRVLKSYDMIGTPSAAMLDKEIF